MLTVKNLSKVYQKRGQEVIALNNVSLDIPQGDFVAIIGPSGSGKSSLLLMLGGMLSPSSGYVRIDNESVYDLNNNARATLRRQKMGFVFQTFNLIPYLTALQNVQVPLLLCGLDKQEQDERSRALLKKVGLEDRLDHKPAELSVGQQQRIALARMMANDPDIILADEPTGNLDPTMGQIVMDFLCELNEAGKTVVMVTHDMKIAGRAKRTVVISKGGTL
ncbi:MAG: ABC transporter ATP-binding protein [Chlamydiales bacterium]|nr:ABC transporter ATP-binding protein [Chlamydiales bacterium]